MPKQLLMGNEAVAHAALAAGVAVVAGYPGTPSSEVVETVAKLHEAGLAQGVHVEWSTNEKAALELVFGASASGARGLFTAKQMGLNVASDALMSLNYVGVRGGLVLYVADDPGPISSQTEQDTRRFASFAKVPVLDPSTPEELYSMIGSAFEISEQYGTPVIVRPTTRICHASTFFEVPGTYEARPIPEGGFEKDDSHWVIFPSRSFRAHAEINERLSAIAQVFSGTVSSAASLDDEREVGQDMPCFNPVVQEGAEAKFGIVAGGVSAAYVREALTLLKAQCREIPAYRFMQVGTPYPFPEEAARRFVEGLEQVLVFEELDYVLEDEFLKLAGKHHLSYEVHGKLDESTLTRGENSTEDACRRLCSFFACDASEGNASCCSGGEALSGTDAAAQAIQAPVRPPVLCAGCPHRGSFYAVKEALRSYRGEHKAVFCGDIGCYTLGNAKPLAAVDTCLCMGAGITMAQGIATVEPGRKALAFIGDSTFFASGLTGVANAVYNNHDITVCILDNSTTAMTGSQPHPGTGATLMGGQSKPINIEETLQALGVQYIKRANAFDFNEAKTAAKQAIDFEGPSAVIFEGPCIQLSKPSTPPTVDEQSCTGCSGCIKSIGCPAMSMGEREDCEKPLMEVNESLCWGCNLCVATCPFGAIRKGVGNA